MIKLEVRTEGGSHEEVQLLEETGNVRDINRLYYSLEEARNALDKPVVKALLDLCRFCNTHPAFAGEVGPTLQAAWNPPNSASPYPLYPLSPSI